MTSPHFTTSPHFGDVPTFWVPEKKAGTSSDHLRRPYILQSWRRPHIFAFQKCGDVARIWSRTASEGLASLPASVSLADPENVGTSPGCGDVVGRFDVPTTWRRPHFFRGCFDVPTFWADPATSPHFLTSPHFSIGRTGSTIALIVSGMALGLFPSLPALVQPGINKNVVLGQHFT